MTTHTELAIVGAGPAGLEAAIAAAAAGVQVTVVDGSPQPGGQYFKQLPDTFRTDEKTRHKQVAQSLFNRFNQLDVQLLSDTLVWGAFPADDGDGWLLNLHGPQAPHSLGANTLILATGAYDRPVSFPGWTLPGVMTAGAVQNLLKSQHVLPGKRVLLSGTGPLQLAVAAGLVKAGAEVVAVLEGAKVANLRGLKRAAAMWGQWPRLREGWDYFSTLKRAGSPLRLGWSVVEARGDDEVREVDIAQLCDDWQPLADSRETVAVDTLVIGYGFIPAVQLSRLLGCRHEFRPEQGGYVPVRDDRMQTSLPGVYAVGDGAGIGGAELSRVEGRVAGSSAAQYLGKLSALQAQTAIDTQRSALARERRFAEMLGDLFTPGPHFYNLSVDSTIICRCEEVTLGEIREAVSRGTQSVNEVKGLTRCGMGNCQGRICGELVARAIAAEQGLVDDYPDCIESVGTFTPRPPIHPLPLSVLADAAE